MYSRPIPIPRPVYGTRCLSASEVAYVKANAAIDAAKTLATLKRGPWPIVNDDPAQLPDMSALVALKDLISTVASVVSQFFPATIAYAPIVANMGSTSNVKPEFFVRIIWLNNHKGIKYTNSDFQQLELINIYLEFPELDWRADKYITVQLDSLGGLFTP